MARLGQFQLSKVGFVGGKENGFQRNGVTFIKNEGNIIKPTERLEIKSNSKIEIHLDKSIQSLESFFSYLLDTTTKNIISFDF